MPGVASAACPTEPTSQPFAHLGDQDNYFLAPGGDFESGPQWSSNGNATVVESTDNGVESSQYAAKLSQSSSMASPTFCVDADRPHLRFAAHALSGEGTLRLDAIQEDGSKILLAKFDAGSYQDWRVTPSVPLAGPLGVADPQTKLVKLRLTALNGTWLADSVYVDPYTRG